ncbi:Protein pinocchio [Nymphon striatum]|nr:Protein pinocchio [Nymphon striatum]
MEEQWAAVSLQCAAVNMLGSSDSIFLRENSTKCTVSRSHIPSLHERLENRSLEDIYYRDEEENMPPIYFDDEPDPSYLDEVFRLEDLKIMYSSCFTCGVSWADGHVSLDCSECGGYAMARPSHFVSYAQWEGTCAMRKADDTKSSVVANQQSPDNTEDKNMDAGTVRRQNFS